jgi:hypothetical protein
MHLSLSVSGQHARSNITYSVHHQSFLTSFVRGIPTHEAPISTGTPPSYCTPELIPGVAALLKITKHKLAGEASPHQGRLKSVALSVPGG